MKKALLVLGSILLLLSFYLYASSYNYGSFFSDWDIKCRASIIKSNPLHILITWFDIGIRFKTFNLCFYYISKSFPYFFLFGWILVALSIFLHFRDNESKNKESEKVEKEKLKFNIKETFDLSPLLNKENYKNTFALFLVNFLFSVFGSVNFSNIATILSGIVATLFFLVFIFLGMLAISIVVYVFFKNSKTYFRTLSILTALWCLNIILTIL